MSRVERAIARLVARPSQARFEDVRCVLEAYGWRQARQKGSHVSFTKQGQRTAIVPLKDAAYVKRHYVEQICALLELDNGNNNRD